MIVFEGEGQGFVQNYSWVLVPSMFRVATSDCTVRPWLSIDAAHMY